MRIGSLFSGIGGLELGLEMAGLGPVVWQVEKDARLREVLADHWPEADRSVTDVRDAESLPPVDLICGGFPCQDVSSAGTGEGLAGARSGLWYEFARIVGRNRPCWVVVENVASGASRWVDDVVQGLGALRYDCLAVPLSASDVGAPQPRPRVFILARRAALLHDEGESPESFDAEVAEASSASAHPDSERETEQRWSESRWTGTSEPDSTRSHSNNQTVPSERYEFAGRSEVGRRHSGWPAQLEVVPPVHGVPGRVVRALGNSVVPQCAEVIGWMIRELEKNILAEVRGEEWASE